MDLLGLPPFRKRNNIASDTVLGTKVGIERRTFHHYPTEFPFSRSTDFFSIIDFTLSL